MGDNKGKQTLADFVYSPLEQQIKVFSKPSSCI